MFGCVPIEERREPAFFGNRHSIWRGSQLLSVKLKDSRSHSGDMYYYESMTIIDSSIEWVKVML